MARAGPSVCSERANVVDRAGVLRIALEAIARGERRDLVGKPIVLVDVPVRNELEAEMVRALVEASGDVLMTVPLGDDHAAKSAPAAALVDDDRQASTALERLQAGLFSANAAPESCG